MNFDPTQKNLPLFELFTRLHQVGLPLGIDEYQLLIKALQNGFGLPDHASLARLCKTLWIKSADEERIFDYQFERLFPLSVVNKSASLRSQSATDQHEASPVTSASEGSSTPVSSTTSELTLAVGDDEVQVANAMQKMMADGSDLDHSSFIQTDEYFPITRRQMKQSWRYLRRLVREGPAVELDVDATLNNVGRHGLLLEPVLVPHRTNRVELLLLIDQGGSMVPFHALSRRLAETASYGGRLGKTNTYYFHNCPTEYVYYDSFHLKAEAVQNILSQVHYEQTSVLIFSDAGAARGGFNDGRVEWTRQFLEKLKQHSRYTAWLNPMPRSRWLGSTAGDIMRMVPMFDFSRQGLDYAINVLRGRPTPYTYSEVRIEW